MLHTAMLFLLIVFLNLFLVGCSTRQVIKSAQPIAQVPLWYQDRLLTTLSYEYIGYGQGASEAVAKAQAQIELAQSIQTDIQITVKNNTLVRGEAISHNEIVASKAESNLRIFDLKRLKIEQVEGQFFVAYKYSNLPVAVKIASSGLPFKCTEQVHPYLSLTPLWQNIAEHLACMPDFEVIYKNNAWYLVAGQAMFSFSRQDFKLLFAKSQHPDLELQLSKGRVQQGDLYHIKLKSHRKGYLSLLQVFDSGQMHVLIDNQLLKPEESMTFPDLNDYDGLVAQGNKARGVSKDLTLAVLCTKPNKLGSIAPISQQALAEDNQQMFSLVMQQIKDCVVSSDIVRIQGSAF